MVVLLVSIALAVSLALGASGATPTFAQASMPTSQLPATMPGLTRDEGVFLVTAADDGSRAPYFIAQNTRHSILSSDLQLEQRLNPLWPVRSASRGEVLSFTESAPIGGARVGLIKVEVEAPVEALAETVDDAPSPVAEEMPSSVAEETPSPVAEEPSLILEDLPGPVVNDPAASAMPHAPTPLQAKPAAPTQDLLAAEPIASEPTTYLLKPGDNLIHISARFGTSVQAILATNGIANPNLIFIGQTLVIPGRAAPDVVESPSAPAPIATDLQEPVADAPASDEVATTYTVKPGDSAITIARKLGVDVDELLATNAVVNRNRVYVGQVLTLPEASS